MACCNGATPSPRGSLPPANSQYGVQPGHRKDLVDLRAEVEKGELPTGGLHPLVEQEEGSQFDAADELDVGEVEQKVAPLDRSRLSGEGLPDHILNTPILAGSEGNDLDAATLLHFMRGAEVGEFMVVSFDVERDEA